MSADHVAGDRQAFVLLVLGAPPPIKVQGKGALSVDAAAAGFTEHGFRPVDTERIAWTT